MNFHTQFFIFDYYITVSRDAVASQRQVLIKEFFFKRETLLC